MGSSTVARLIADAERMAALAAAVGVPARANLTCEIERLPCVLTNMTTEDLARIRLGSGRAARSLVVKIAQSPRHSPLWERIPAQFHERVMFDLPWRAEPDLYASPLASLLPAGMRTPVVYAVEPLDDDRIALWMEDVVESGSAWEAADYQVAARALGRLAGRLPEQAIPATLPVQRRDLRSYFFGRVQFGTLPELRDDATWSHPLVADAVDPQLREDIEVLAASAPRLLEQLDALPRTLAHGDACPQNMLRPRDEPGTVVAIDWTFAGVCAVGMDAGQLLAGRAETGELDPAELPKLLEVIVEEYQAGLCEEGADVDPEHVRLGALGNLVIRSAFTALPVELLGEGGIGDAAVLFERRARYARFLVDLGRGLVT